MVNNIREVFKNFNHEVFNISKDVILCEEVELFRSKLFDVNRVVVSNVQ